MTRYEFADPYGRSALRAESKTNPRNLPCQAQRTVGAKAWGVCNL